MASQDGSKRSRDERDEDGGSKKQKLNDEKKTTDLVRKLFNERDREKREQNIQAIAELINAKNDKRTQISKLAEMVKKTKTLYKEKRNYNIEDRDLIELAALVQERQNVDVPKKDFSAELLRTHQRFGYTEYIFDINVGSANMNSLPDFFINLRSVFDYLINTMLYYAQTKTDKARFYISNAPRTPFSTSILNVSDFTTEMFFNIFEKHMQSNAQEIINNGWNTTVSLYIFPNDYVPRKKKPVKKKKINDNRLYKYFGRNTSESGTGKQNEPVFKYGREARHGVFQIGNSNVRNCCLALALLVGKSYLHNDFNAAKLKRNSHIPLSDIYTDDAITNMYTVSQLPVGAPVCINQLPVVYERYLKPDGIDLVVFSKQQADSIVYDSRLDTNQNLHRVTNEVIFLWLNDDHYDLVTSPYTFARLNLGRFCFSCMKYFRRHERKTTHVCILNTSCQRCYCNTRYCESVQGFFQQCTECDVLFYNPDCFTKHLTQKVFKTYINGVVRSVTPCQRFFFCASCYKVVARKTMTSSKKYTNHKCDEMFCLHCNAMKKKDHHCYIKPIKDCKNESRPTLYFYDFETRVNEGDIYMIPFYCVVQKVCDVCDQKPFVKNYEHFLPHPSEPFVDISVDAVPCCGYRQYVFDKNNDDIVADLVDFMMTQPKNSVWVAHNGGRFDSIFLMRELLIHRKIVPTLIMNGSKVMSLELEQRNLKVIDSYLFLAMKLAKFPEALGIENATKGFHPYLFTDLNYVGEMVGLEYFELPAEGSEERKTFDRWYREQQNKTYVFREAIYYYCRMDVDILRRGCIIFSRLIHQITGILPFYDRTCNTVAGMALKIYRKNFLKNEQIGQIPACGYGGVNINQSAIALCWLRDVEISLDENNQKLASKLSVGGERRIMGRYVDGYCEETNTIYQFHGCFYHGCDRCYDGQCYNNVSATKFHTLFTATQRLSRTFVQAGYTVVEKWECDYRNEVDMSPYRLKQLRLTSFFEFIQLEPRDALFGGRTSPAVLYYDMAVNGLPAMYYDVCSLYPYVQKKFRYPTQHPVILKGKDCENIDVNHVFGLIKCKILPPTHLLFPVLPYRSNKLTFPLCRTCVDCQQRETCRHGDEQRALYGTWTSVEIQKALQLDYRILVIYEIYHFTKTDKIFDQYVNTFIKLKQESSGIPKKCLNENGEVIRDLLQKYIDDYMKHEGVALNVTNMNYNAGQRTVMKALLNSLWGKLAQNEDVTVVSFLESMDELLDLVNDRTVEVTSLDFISDNMAKTTHRKTASLTTLTNRNVIIASFVTAYARLELLEYLLKLGENVLYYDTDSVIFTEDRANGKFLETGEYLGQMTDELVEKRTTAKWITQFCSAGPKSYSYRTNVYTRTNDDGTTTEQSDEIVHVKGFSLKGPVKKILTFDTIRECVEDPSKKIEITYREFIRENTQSISKEKSDCLHDVVLPFEHPFVMNVCGPTQSGKTYLLVNIIKNIDVLIQPTPDKLLYLYSAEQKLYGEITDHVEANKEKSALKECEFYDCVAMGIPTIEHLRPMLGKRTLLVLDDLMVLAMASKEGIENLNNLVTRDSHHLDLSVFFVCQTLNYGNGKIRSMRTNSMYHLLFNNHTDTRDIELVARNKGIRLPTIRKILSDVGKKEYGYVLFDGCPHSPANTRVRTGILPQECTIIYDIEKPFV
ncbi:DNA polymerase [Paramuricea clavata]|uniref:DNA-directed DNA polymerase n=1 Tax=Paramuricea clavata TaxID=317549 RepID=A0A7D9HAQ4_PARCT|nr:DNA polymerase [Paramuricea clavata]